MSTTTELTTAWGTWTVEAPDGVTVTPAPDPTVSTSPVTIQVDYGLDTFFGPTKGVIDLIVREPAGGPLGGTDQFGLRYPIIFEFTNNLGVQMDGLVLSNQDETAVPANPDTNGHPQQYAHFHGVQPTSFPGLTTSVLLQDASTPADFGGPGAVAAPGQIRAVGAIPTGGQPITSEPFVLHQWDQAGINDSFKISLHPLLTTGQILVTAAAGEVSQNEGNGGETTYTFTISRLGDNAAIDANPTTVQYDVVGFGTNPTDAADFTGGVVPQGTVTFAPTEFSKTISFTVAGDTAFEQDETFRIELSNATDGAVVVNAGEATGTLVNDDEVATPTTIKNLTPGNDFWPGPGFPGDTNGGDEIINGLAGSDTINGGAGNDTINGGTGKDTAIWSSFRKQGTVSINPETDSTVTGPEGTDTVRNIERYVFADGEFIADTAHEAAQVYRLYNAALDRTPDQNGLKSWTSALLSDTSTLEQVAQGFTDSPEFKTKYGNLNDRAYITQLYQNVLDRNPDPGGLAAWEGGLKGGLSRAEVLVGFSESPENIDKTRGAIEEGLWVRDDQAAIIARMYDTVLDRLPDAPGLLAWKGGLQGGMSLNQVADGFTNSPEFQAKYGALDNEAFVKQLYLNVLDREGEPSGVEAWKGGLDGGVSRSQVVLGFSESPEHQSKLAAFIDDGINLV